MSREDYISLMIEQIAALIRRIFNQSESQELLESELEDLTGKWVGLPTDVLLALPVEEVHSLVEDSDRLVVEKCYVLSELYRAKGIGSEDMDEQLKHFKKSLYFYDKCSGLVGDGLQHEIDDHVKKLSALVSETPKLSVTATLDAVLSPPTISDSDYAKPRVSATSKRKQKNAVTFWLLIGICIFTATLVTVFSKPSIEVCDTDWVFRENIAHVEFDLINRTDDYQTVDLKLSADSYTNDAYSSGYSFLGGVERSYTIRPKSTKAIVENFEYQRKSSGGSRSVSVEIVSSQSKPEIVE